MLNEPAALLSEINYRPDAKLRSLAYGRWCISFINMMMMMMMMI